MASPAAPAHDVVRGVTARDVERGGPGVDLEDGLGQCLGVIGAPLEEQLHDVRVVHLRRVAPQVDFASKS